MQTFILPKHDGTKYEITGQPLTPVWRDPQAYIPIAADASVIALASGERILYVYHRPVYRLANRTEFVGKVYRNAQNMTAESVADATGRAVDSAFITALNLAEVEKIQ